MKKLDEEEAQGTKKPVLCSDKTHRGPAKKLNFLKGPTKALMGTYRQEEFLVLLEISQQRREGEEE